MEPIQVSFYARRVVEKQTHSMVGSTSINISIDEFCGEYLPLLAEITRKQYQQALTEASKKHQNPKEASKEAKKSCLAIFAQYRHQWAGRSTIVTIDTDWHKTTKDFNSKKQYYINQLKALPYCLAIVGSVNGGISPLFLVDTDTLPPELKQGKKVKKYNTVYKVMELPQFIFDGLEPSKNLRDKRYVGCNQNQPRIVYDVIWSNPDCTPYEYKPLSGDYLSHVNKGLNWAQKKLTPNPLSNFTRWLDGELPLHDTIIDTFKAMNWITPAAPVISTLPTTEERKEALSEVMRKVYKHNKQALTTVAEAFDTVPENIATIRDNVTGKLYTPTAMGDEEFRREFMPSLNYEQWQVVINRYGSGKSYFFQGGKLRCLLLVNSREARKQMYQDMVSRLGPDKVCMVNVNGANSKINLNATVFVMTHAKLAKHYGQSVEIQRMINSCVCIVADEFQNLKTVHYNELLRYGKPVTLLSANDATAMIPDEVKALIPAENFHIFERPENEKPVLKIFIRQTEKVDYSIQYGQSRLVNNRAHADLKQAKNKTIDAFGERPEDPSPLTVVEYETALKSGKKVSHTTALGEGVSIRAGHPISVEWNVGGGALNGFALTQSLGRYRDGVKELHLTLARSVYGDIQKNELNWLVYFADMVSIKDFKGLKNKLKLAPQLSELQRSYTLDFEYVGMVDNNNARERTPRKTGVECVRAAIVKALQSTAREADQSGNYDRLPPTTAEEALATVPNSEWGLIFEKLDLHKNLLTMEERNVPITLSGEEAGVYNTLSDITITINDVVNYAANNNFTVIITKNIKTKNNTILTDASLNGIIPSQVYIEHIRSGLPENSRPEERKVVEIKDKKIVNKKQYETVRRGLNNHYYRLGFGGNAIKKVHNFHLTYPEMSTKEIVSFFRVIQGGLSDPEVEFDFTQKDRLQAYENELWEAFYTPTLEEAAEDEMVILDDEKMISEVVITPGTGENEKISATCFTVPIFFTCTKGVRKLKNSGDTPLEYFKQSEFPPEGRVLDLNIFTTDFNSVNKIT